MIFLAFEFPAPVGGMPVDVVVPDTANNISKLLTALCSGGVQPLEDCLRQLLTQRTLDTAIASQLDVIGKIVGLPRGGLDDDTYRRLCRAMITVHRSNGMLEDLLQVLNLVVFDDTAHYVVVERELATVQIRIENIAVSDALALLTYSFLARAASAGIRVILDYGAATPTDWFRFDSGPGFNQGHLIGRVDH